MISLSSKTLKILYSIVAGILVVAVVWGNTWKLTEFLNIQSGTLLNRLVKDMILILSVLFFTSIVIKPKDVLSFLGLNGNIVKGLGIALLCVAPIYIGFTIFGTFNADTSLALLLSKSILPGFKEEFVFRAFMFGLLFRYSKTGFLGAVIFPALYFGSLHLYQGHDIISSLAAFGLTFLGAIYFSWMYVEWNFNIWVPVGLHILMNGAWVLFTMEGTEVAAGGMISNTMRVISILLAIFITIWYKKKNNTKIFNYPVWKL